MAQISTEGKFILLVFFSDLHKHNRLTGLDVEKDRIELWEESSDGSGIARTVTVCTQWDSLIYTVTVCTQWDSLVQGVMVWYTQ